MLVSILPPKVSIGVVGFFRTGMNVLKSAKNHLDAQTSQRFHVCWTNKSQADNPNF